MLERRSTRYRQTLTEASPRLETLMATHGCIYPLTVSPTPSEVPLHRMMQNGVRIQGTLVASDREALVSLKHYRKWNRLREKSITRIPKFLTSYHLSPPTRPSQPWLPAISSTCLSCCAVGLCWNLSTWSSLRELHYQLGATYLCRTGVRVSDINVKY